MSERALRYYQQLGLLVPACTPGGLRRYSAEDLARVARIRELQTLLGLNLDEIAVVLRNEDRLAQIRLSYHDERTSDSERRRLTRECLTLQESLRATVEAKRAALEGFLADLDARIRKCRDLLASAPDPEPGQPADSGAAAARQRSLAARAAGNRTAGRSPQVSQDHPAGSVPPVPASAAGTPGTVRHVATPRRSASGRPAPRAAARTAAARWPLAAFPAGRGRRAASRG